MSDLSDLAKSVLAALALPEARLRQAVLIGIFGLPGSGKSTLAEYLASYHPLVLLSTDVIRLRYSLPSGPATLEILYELAGYLLSKHYSVIIDGIHLRKVDRNTFHKLGSEFTAQTILIYTHAARHVIEERLAERIASPVQTRAEGKFVITPEHFARIAAYLEEPAQHEEVWTIDTSLGSPEEQASSINILLQGLKS